MTAAGQGRRSEPSLLWSCGGFLSWGLSRVPSLHLLGLVAREAICCAGLSLPAPSCRLRTILTLPVRDREWREGRGIRAIRPRASASGAVPRSS